MRWGSGNGKGSPAFTGQVILLFCRMLRVAHVPGRSQDHLRVNGVDKRQGGAATIRRDGGFQKACITVACHRPLYGGLLRLGQTGRSDLRPASGRDQMSSNVAVWRIAAALQALLSTEARIGLAGPCHATSHSLGVLAEHAVRRSMPPNTPPVSRSRGMPPARRLPGCAAVGWPGDRGRRAFELAARRGAFAPLLGGLWPLGLWLGMAPQDR